MRRILTLLIALFATAAANPMPIVSELLFTRFMLEQEEPTVWAKDVQFAFLPEGATVRAVYKNGDDVLSEKSYGGVEIYGAISLLAVRGIGTIPLGTNEGPRSIEFYVNDQLVYTLGFTMTKETSGDAFNPRTVWHIDGPWSQVAHFWYDPERGAGEPVSLIYYAGSHEVAAGAEVVAIIRRGGTELARTDVRTVQGAGYSRFQQDILIDGRNRMTVGELGRFDGDLTIDIVSGGSVLRTFYGRVANGAFVPHPRSDHTAVDAQSFLSPRYVSDNNQIRGGISPMLLAWVTTDPR
jgi:hypothetical protein